MPEKTAISGMQDFWIALEKALFEPIPGETLADRLGKRPWNCDLPAVKAAWDGMTHPNNLAALQKWASEPMTPSIREITDAAIRVCEERVAKAKAGGAGPATAVP